MKGYPKQDVTSALPSKHIVCPVDERHAVAAGGGEARGVIRQHTFIRASNLKESNVPLCRNTAVINYASRRIHQLCMQQRRVGGVPNSPLVLSFSGSRFLFDLWSHEATVLRVPLVGWCSIVPRLGISMSTLDEAG